MTTRTDAASTVRAAAWARVDFGRIFDASPTASMVLDRTQRFVAANAAYLRLTGSTLEDLLGRRVFDVFPNVPGDPNDPSVARVRASLLRVLENGEPDVLPLVAYRVPRTPGGPLEERFWSATHSPVRDERGEVAYVLQDTRDVTEQVHREAASADLARHVLAESIPQQVWTARPDGQLDFVNERVVDYLQSPRARVLGDGWQDVIHPDDLAGCMARWRHSLETGELYELEFRLRRGDGQYRWHLARAEAWRDGTGAVRKWFGTNTDVDDYNKIREELRARSESEQQLIGIVSHDLRNPLNTIGLAASLLLQKRAEGDPEAKILKRMVRSMERAGRLIRDFLDLAQSRSGRTIPIHPRTTNLRELVEQVVSESRLADPDRAVEVSHLGEDTGRWDTDRLAQVLGNLVDNAFQHGARGGPVAIVSQVDTHHATIEIHNTGPAIAPETLACLFEPFQRGRSSRSSAPGGRSVGLGLYIARQVVAAHGGTIGVTSTSAAGTRFRVRLPREVPGDG
jgi:PAS domain S-box-containing protein